MRIEFFCMEVKMIESITLGDVYGFLMAAAAFITTMAAAGAIVVKTVKKQLSNAIKPTLDEALKPIHEDVISIKSQQIGLEQQINDLTLEECKNYLVRYIEDVKNDETVGAAEIERYYEVRDRYFKLGGNGYIHAACDEIEKKLK